MNTILSKKDGKWMCEHEGEYLQVSNPDVIEELEKYETEEQPVYRWNGSVEKTAISLGENVRGFLVGFKLIIKK